MSAKIKQELCAETDPELICTLLLAISASTASSYSSAFPRPPLTFSYHSPLPLFSSILPRQTAQLMTTLAPSFPKTPLSIGFGLLSLPFFLPRNASIPLGFPFAPPMPSSPSTGIVTLWFASSVQDPVASSTTCTPPPLLAFRVPPRCRCCCGIGRLKDGGLGLGAVSSGAEK